MTDWTQHRRDARRSGADTDLADPHRPAAAWTTSLPGAVSDSPTLDEAAVYVGTDAGDCYAVDRRDGGRRWLHETETATSAPVVTRETIYVASRESLVALERDSGTVRWRVDDRTGIDGPPALTGDRLFLGHADGLSAVHALTGETLWTHETDDPVVGPTAVADGRAFVGTAGEHVTAIDASPDGNRHGDSGRPVPTAAHDDAVGHPKSQPSGDDEDEAAGRELWSAPTDGLVVDGPVTAEDGRVYVADDDGTMLALAPETGQTWFTYEAGSAFTAAPTVVDDTTFVPAEDGYLHVTDTQFGNRRLRGLLFSKKGVALDDVASAGPALVGETLVLGDDGGNCYGIDAADPDFRWHRPLDAPVTSAPAPAREELFVGYGEGLACLRWGER